MMNPRISIAILLILVACGREAGQEQADAPAPDAGPQQGGRLVVALDGEPSSLNPLLFTDLPAGVVFGMMHHGLARMDGDLRWQPGLATGWTPTEDGRGLDVHLRPGLLWSDGQPFVPEDVIRSYALYTNPEVASRRAGEVRPVQEITALDERTLRMTFARPGAEPERYLAVDILPWHVVEGLDPADVKDWPLNRAPFGLGPFRFRSWTPGVRLVLERNPHYYGPPALLDEIEVKILPDRVNHVLQLQSGEVDVVLDVPGIDLDRLEADENVRLVTLTGRRMNFIMLNLESPLFQDARVRQAISFAIDRRALVDGILYGRGQPASSFVPPIAWSHDESLEADPYDAEQAALLLTQAGWTDSNGDGTRDKDGIEFHFELTTRAGDSERENAAILMRRNLEAVGLSANIVLLENATQQKRAGEGDFDATVVQLTAPTIPNPDAFVVTGGRANFGRYSNPEIDALLEQAQTTADRETARPLWHRVQRILHEDRPMIMLYYPSQVMGMSARVRDATPNLVSSLGGIETWWVAQ